MFTAATPAEKASYPAISPWMTSVGSTWFEGDKVGGEEVATLAFGSGGGFSYINDAPDYQHAAVSAYLRAATRLPPLNGTFSRDGRATPDLAALGWGYKVVYGGATIMGGGTSASTPLFAALVSLMVEARLQQGMAPMGCLNAWLYGLDDAAFTDVTKGNNSYLRTQPMPVMYGPFGFDAAKGWDPVSGRGTPNFDVMLKAALKGP